MRYFCIVAVCFLAIACDYRGRAVSGTVLEVTNFEAPPEQWKFRPIHGAEVVVYWEGYKQLYSHGGRTYCLASTYATSNEDGRFSVPEIRVARAVSGIEGIVAVSAAYVPGFVMLRPHEHAHPIFAGRAVRGPAAHVFRRATDPAQQDRRETLFYNAGFCPSKEFL